MVEIAVELLFVRFGSLVVALTVAVLLAVDPELKVDALTLMVTITSPPTLIEPRGQLTVVVAAVYVQDPCVVETEVKVTWLGSASLTVTPCATAGPLFVTCSV